MSFSFDFRSNEDSREHEDFSFSYAETEYTTQSKADTVSHRYSFSMTYPRSVCSKSIVLQSFVIPHISELGELIPIEGVVIRDARQESSNSLTYEGTSQFFIPRPLNMGLCKSELNDRLAGIYEGGHKIWSCSIDLASYLLSQNLCLAHNLAFNILELGCGNALPTLALLRTLSCRYESLLELSRITVSLQDYNQDVLEKTTLNNLINHVWGSVSNVTDVIQNKDKKKYEVTFHLLRTSWERLILEIRNISRLSSRDLKALLGNTARDEVPSKVYNSNVCSKSIEMDVPPAYDLILGADVCFTDQATAEIAQCIVQNLRRVPHAKALIASKKYYFGTGGGSSHLSQAIHDLTSLDENKWCLNCDIIWLSHDRSRVIQCIQRRKL